MRLRAGLLATSVVSLVSGNMPGATFAESALDGIVSGSGLDGFVKVDRLPVPENAALAQGREIWGATCFKCHGGNKAIGAPKITSTEDWAPRIEQGMDVLYTHVLEGFIGPTYSFMPPRGGADLTDEELALAMSFMVWASGGADAAYAYLEKVPQQTEQRPTPSQQ